MGFRLRKSVKIGPVRFNLSKSGVSTSVGGRGGSVTFGKTGVYANYGLPGTGISHRSKIGGGSKKSASTQSIDSTTQRMAIKFSLDDETGMVRWEDEHGNPLPEEVIKIAKKQNREIIETTLENGCETFNDRLDAILRIHHGTPPPYVVISYAPAIFDIEKPQPPDEGQYQVERPKPPKVQNQNFLSKRIGALGKNIDQKNQKNNDEYESLLKIWEEQQQAKNQLLELAHATYQQQLNQWQEQKVAFEKEQERRKWVVEIGRSSDLDAMQEFLEERLASLEWPLDTNVSFELANGGTQIFVDVDLPEIETMQTKVAKVNHTKLELTISEYTKTQLQQNYLTHIHSIGFRMIGEAFAALPSVNEVILSAYSQRTSRKTANMEDEYLYSVRVQRDAWNKINFGRLSDINVVDCFELFELRRKVTRQGAITPIAPFMP